MTRTDTRDLIKAIADEGTWRPWDTPFVDVHPDDEYLDELEDARTRSGSDESVVTGSARVAEQQIAIIAGEFNFLAGSVGRSAASRLMSAVDRATAWGLPILALPTSGGTRMQEGTPAFLLMAGIAAAVRRHSDAGLPYLVFLRNPTTGGVLATWGSLGDFTFAEPGALVGFLGPRVYKGLYGHDFPEGVQTAEGLADAGVIDGVRSPEQLRGTVADILLAYRARAITGVESISWEATELTSSEMPAEVSSRLHTGEESGAWDAVLATRQNDRPGLAEFLTHVDGFQPLSGTQAGETAGATVAGIGQIDGVGSVIVGYDRRAQAAGRLVGPADLRVARRAMALAQHWRLPLVTVIDTQGGELSADAESGALAGEIARCLADMSALQTPTLSVLTGGGAGGVALALLPADRVIAAADAWITPLPPEGASLIRHRTTQRAAEMAEAQHITARDMQAVGAVDRIVEPPQGDAGVFAAAVGEELSVLAARPVDIGARAGKWSAVGFD